MFLLKCVLEVERDAARAGRAMLALAFAICLVAWLAFACLVTWALGRKYYAAVSVE